MSPNAEEGRGYGVSANEYSCAHGAQIKWRCNSICNLWIKEIKVLLTLLYMNKTYLTISVSTNKPLCVCYQMYFFLLYFETEHSQAIKIFIYVHPKMDYFVTDIVLLFKREGLSRDSNPGPPAPKAGIMPLDHWAAHRKWHKKYE